MHELRSSDINNSTYIDALNNNSDLVLNMRKAYKDDASILEYLIFNNEIDDKSYKILMTALTMGDLFTVSSMDWGDAYLLFFVLNVNRAYYTKELPLRITNRTQAYMVFKECQGNFRDIDIKFSDDGKDHNKFVKFLARHKVLWPEKNIYWEIPVSFYKNKETNENFVFLGGKEWATFAYAQIGDNKIKIPRSLFIKFFQSSMVEGKVVGKTTDDIRLMFDETNSEAVYETLSYMGYSTNEAITNCFEVDYFFDPELDKLCAKPLSKVGNQFFIEDPSFTKWEKLNNNVYVLYKLIDYIPTNVIEGAAIFIYK